LHNTLLLLALLSGVFCRGGDFFWQDNLDMRAVFEDADASGTFVVLDWTSQTLIGSDETRARTRFIPASTFKIANTIIGLTVGAVSDVDEVLPYGGQPQPIKKWEQDMGLRQAIRISNVPVYQELARRIGKAQMQTMVKKLGYGNQTIGDVVDNFWLAGPLEISPVEQVSFLARLVHEELPVPKEVQRATKEILLIDQGSDWKLYAKTGWTTAPDPDTGWWVGWLERRRRIYIFALNMDMTKADDGEKRKSLGLACLKTLGLL